MVRKQKNVLLQRQMDKKLLKIKGLLEISTPPHKGWIQAISQALGMPGTILAKRMKIAQPTLAKMQKAEASGSITLSSLEKAAEALECRLMYVLIPKTSLKETIKTRATKVAKKMVEEVSISMALESQGISKPERERQAQEMAEELARQGGRKLWSDQ